LNLTSGASELFNTTMDAVEEASEFATDPVIKAKLDCIYDNLEVVREQVPQAVLDTQPAVGKGTPCPI
jgi:hypothetical protein